MKRLTQEEAIKKFKEVHGDRYSYEYVNFVNTKTKVVIVCSEHGRFEQRPFNHSNGEGCPECGKKTGRSRKTTEQFIKEAREVHGDRYDYSKVDYVAANLPVTITCKIHGDFEQIANTHLKGSNCIRCSYDDRGSERRLAPKEVEDRVREKLPINITLESMTNYKNNTSSIELRCSKHGTFNIPFTQIMASDDVCPKCSNTSKILKSRKSQSQFLKEAQEIHGDKYDYSKTNYTTAHSKVIITCKIHGDFEQVANEHRRGQGCPKCGSSFSKAEQSITEFIYSLGVSAQVRRRDILKSGKEIDIFVPEFNLGIEHNGLIWHSDKFGVKKETHLNKTEEAIVQGIDLFHVFEDEWENKSHIIKSMIENRLGKSLRIHARECVIEEVSNSELKPFMTMSHLKGMINSKYNIVLKYKGEIVAAMSFSEPRINMGKKNTKSGEYELTRFVNKLGSNVVGGASKLLRYFERTYNPTKVYTYSDRRYSEGDLYLKLGFNFIGTSEPNYFYTRNGQFRLNRFQFRKSILVGQGEDPSLTEKEIMRRRGYYRIYDCGTNRFEKVYST